MQPWCSSRQATGKEHRHHTGSARHPLHPACQEPWATCSCPGCSSGSAAQSDHSAKSPASGRLPATRNHQYLRQRGCCLRMPSRKQLTTSFRRFALRRDYGLVWPQQRLSHLWQSASALEVPSSGAPPCRNSSALGEHRHTWCLALLAPRCGAGFGCLSPLAPDVACEATK